MWRRALPLDTADLPPRNAFVSSQRLVTLDVLSISWHAE